MTDENPCAHPSSLGPQWVDAEMLCSAWDHVRSPVGAASVAHSGCRLDNIPFMASRVSSQAAAGIWAVQESKAEQ